MPARPAPAPAPRVIASRAVAPLAPAPRALAPIALAVLALTACSSAGPQGGGGSKFFDPPTGAAGASSQTDVERYFPLVDGNIYSYQTENEAGERGLLIARVHRSDATHGELHFPTGKRKFVYAADGVHIEPTGDFVLAAPLVAGATFRGQNGGQARIEDTEVVIDVRAGSYRGCIRVVEDRGGDRRARYVTTFCPGVGVVAIEAQSGSTYERAELVSAGPPVNIERDGLSVVPPGTPETPSTAPASPRPPPDGLPERGPNSLDDGP